MLFTLPPCMLTDYTFFYLFSTSALPYDSSLPHYVLENLFFPHISAYQPFTWLFCSTSTSSHHLPLAYLIEACHFFIYLCVIPCMAYSYTQKMESPCLFGMVQFLPEYTVSLSQISKHTSI